MNVKTGTQKGIIALGVIVLLGQASAAQAVTVDKSVYFSKTSRPAEHHKDYDRNDHDKGYQKEKSSFIFTFSIGGVPYYYSDGHYYRREGRDYRRCMPPRGSVVYSLPIGYRTHYYRGEPYYWHSGVCYKRYRGGYRIVEAPINFTYATYPKYEEPVQNQYTVNIPNKYGGYTGILMKRSGDGFVGPQGEYYDEFPSVEQLKLLYGK